MSNEKIRAVFFINALSLIGVIKAIPSLRVLRFDGTCAEHPGALEVLRCPNKITDTRRMILNCTISVKEDMPEFAQTSYHIQRCGSLENPDSCEDFFKQDTSKPCALYSTGIWKQFTDSYSPPLGCPAKKGFYRSVNSSLDVRSFFFFPIGNWYWRVNMIAKHPSTGEVICCVKVDTHTSS